jgi:uncharacterized membrane protein
MKIPFWELKNDSRNLIRGHWNILVLTLFIPFILYFILIGKFVLRFNTIEQISLMSNYKFNITFNIIMYFFSIANIAVFSGIDKIKNNEKLNIFNFYKIGFSNAMRYLPTFFLCILIPNLISIILSPDMIMDFYDYLLFAVMDVQAIGFIYILIQYIIIAVNIYISMSILFVPIILVDKKNITGFDALKQSFKLSKGIRWYLFFFGVSFFGWFLLGAIALFIGVLWVAVYYNASLYSYYNRITGVNLNNFDENQMTIEY